MSILGAVVVGAGLVVATLQFSGAMDITGEPTVDEDDIRDGDLQVSQFPITLGYEIPNLEEETDATVYMATEQHENWEDYVEYDSTEADVDELFESTVTGEDLVQFTGHNEPGDLYAVAVSDDYHTAFSEYNLDEWVNEAYFSQDTPYRVDHFRNMPEKGIFSASSAQIFDVDDEQTGFDASSDSVTVGSEDDRVDGTFTVEDGEIYLGEVDVTVADGEEVDVMVYVDGTEEYSATVDDEGDSSDLVENMNTDPLVVEDEVSIVVDDVEGLPDTESVTVEVMDIYDDGEVASMEVTGE